MISYLPLSHSAAQIVDIFGAIYSKATLNFADENALQGSLGQTLKEVRPTTFVAVPRVYEKIEEKIKNIAAQRGSLAKKIGAWAKPIGYKASLNQLAQKATSWDYSIANALVFSKIKQALGLDRCEKIIVSAAPISKSTLEFFLSLNIKIANVYGMSESAAPTSLNLPHANNI